MLSRTTDPEYSYPEAPRGNTVDDYHGTRVADPYRWLEDVDSEPVQRWVTAENDVTERYLSGVPQRAAIRARLLALWDYEKWGVPLRAGPWYVTVRNRGLQNQAVVYVSERIDGEPRVLIDPNALSADGTVALTRLDFTADGRRVAYAVSASGSDWMTWRVRDVATGEDLADVVEWSKFSTASWSADGSGFYYSRYDAPPGDAQFRDTNTEHQLWFHRLGTPQADDRLIYRRPDHPEWNVVGGVTDDGRWLVIATSHGTDPNTFLFLRDLRGDEAPVEPLLAAGDARYEVIGNDDETFFVFTTQDAPRGRVVAVRRDGTIAREIVSQQDDALESVALRRGRLLCVYLHDAISRVRVFDLDGREGREIALPGLGTVAGFEGRTDEGEAFFSFTSYTQPTTMYRYDVESGALDVVFAPHSPFDSAAYVSEQLAYRSNDGTRIPMIVTARRDVARDGSAPTILYGYGGFNISQVPTFSPAIAMWLEMGGAWAVPNIRGGGEYGEAWHEGGTLANKQNVFDDFIAAAETLIAERWTSTPRLAIFGGSNGGLLVGACMTQRPDLFGAALAAVGVMDMLRFAQFTIGWAWIPEYGDASADAQQFATLYAYSPLHRVREGEHYPATLITTADHDDRVYPAHSFKFAAALQHAQGGPEPILIRVERKAGHGLGKPTSKIVEEAVDRYTFLVRALDFTPALPKT